MAANLLISLTQKEITKPYKFKTTNTNVFSMEEALYHCYHYWKQSVDDFLSEEFIDWVNDTLGLSLLAAKLREFSRLGSFSQQLLSFLSVTDYFSSQDFTALKKELAVWEKRQEWEKLKERGDYLINNDEPQKAFILYKKALDYSENIVLLNNAGIALMKQGKSGEAGAYFERAMEIDSKNINLILHYIESLILGEQYDKADEYIKYAEAFGEISELHYFRGEINFYIGNYFSSVPHYEKAISLKNDPIYIYRLCDVFVKLRQYDKALEAIENVEEKDKLYLKKRADIYIAYNNVPAAIKCMERALLSNKGSVDLWTRLARYHRLDYDLKRANNAIVAAINLAPDDPKVKLEYAKIRKAQGMIKDYQTLLSSVLKGFKRDYRENAGIE